MISAQSASEGVVANADIYLVQNILQAATQLAQVATQGSGGNITTESSKENAAELQYIIKEATILNIRNRLDGEPGLGFSSANLVVEASKQGLGDINSDSCGGGTFEL